MTVYLLIKMMNVPDRLLLNVVGFLQQDNLRTKEIIIQEFNKKYIFAQTIKFL